MVGTAVESSILFIVVYHHLPWSIWIGKGQTGELSGRVTLASIKLGFPHPRLLTPLYLEEMMGPT